MKKQAKKIISASVLSVLLANTLIVPTYAKSYDELKTELIDMQTNKKVKEEEKEEKEKEIEDAEKVIEEHNTEIKEYQKKIDKFEIDVKETKEKKEIKKEEKEFITAEYQNTLQSYYKLDTSVTSETVYEKDEVNLAAEQHKVRKENSEYYDYICGVVEEYTTTKIAEYQNHINILQQKNLKASGEIQIITIAIESIDGEIDKLNKEIDEKKEEVSVAIESSDSTDIDMAWPSYATRITSHFGYRTAPCAGASTYHQGIDIGASYGTDVNSAASGTVTEVSYNGSMGNYVTIKHSNAVQTQYLHLSSKYVSVGDHVEQGEAIGAIGSTGASTGPHLHFSVIVNGSFVDPMNYVSP